MKRVSRYSVREEPSYDEYVFCSSCGDYVYEYCSIHGPLLVIPDDEVPPTTGLPTLVPRAALSIPRMFLHLAVSKIPGAGIGVFSTLTLPAGVRFGPYLGLKSNECSSAYCWQIFDRDRKPAHVCDARDPNRSNWLRYVNCSRHLSEQNLVAYQYRGQVYYRTIKIIPRFTELLVFYGSQFASELNIDTYLYQSPDYVDILPNTANAANIEEKSESNKIDEFDPTVDIKEDASATQQFTNAFISGTAGTSEGTHIELNNKNNDSDDQNNLLCESNILNHSFQSSNEKAALTEHIAVEDVINKPDKGRTYVCLICNYVFLSKSKLINHEIEIHDSKINYKACTQCDYKTVHSSHLKAHIATHNRTGQITGTKFNDEKSHSKMHDGGKLFACTICGYRSKKYCNLKQHQMTHSDERPFTCVKCNKSYRQKKSLIRHAKIHFSNPSPDLSTPSISNDTL